MQSTDNKQLALAKAARRPQLRRSVSKKDFTLPKAYRRQLFSEGPERLTRMQLSLLGFAAVMVTTLFAVLALLAHESDRSPDGKLIVAAAKLAPAERAAPAVPAEAQPAAHALHSAQAARPAQPTPPVQKATAMPPVPSVSPVLRSAPVLAALPPVKAKPLPAITGVRRNPTPHPRIVAALLSRDSKAKPIRPQPVTPVRVLDPDVALITAILLLTPAPAPAAVPAISLELVGRNQAACLAPIPHDGACLDLPEGKTLSSPRR